MNIYEQIAERTNGNIYVGVVGPVRTGKSTFITKFMEQMVLPNLENNTNKARMIDELPQSGSGKQIMTMEPRFVPNNPVSVAIDKTKANIRLVDCVGYMIDGAVGSFDEKGNPRKVKTPWADKPIDFAKASEIGTTKVIKDHSTVGVLVTTDGTITDIDRKAYVQAEERTVKELKELGKPFVILLNTITPGADATLKLKKAMEDKYKVTVLVKDILEIKEKDFVEIFEKLLYEFPVQKIEFNLPDWAKGLDEANDIIVRLLADINKVNIEKMAESSVYEKLFNDGTGILNPSLKNRNLGTGEMEFDINLENTLFFKTLTDVAGADITNDHDLLDYIVGASKAKAEYDKLKLALDKATETGYGVVVPPVDEMELLDPIVVKKNGADSLKLKAKATSLHIMKVDVETEVTPAMGGGMLITNNENGEPVVDSNEIWNTNIFGKTMADIAHDSIMAKLNTFPQEAETKLRKTVTKITNEGKGGIICILL